MNDFTKEELGQIHEILVDVCRQWKEPDSTYELRDKIQSMIDNYCEQHTWIESYNADGRMICFHCKAVKR